MNDKVARLVKCPECGEPAPFSKSNPYKPFCSRQCKLIDLGAWLREERAIPGQSDYRDDSQRSEYEE